MQFRSDEKGIIKQKEALTLKSLMSRISDKAAYVSSLGYTVD